MVSGNFGTTVWLAGLTVLMPAVALAQSAIVGVVKDSSGAVLPGVTVEASSDVLIEKVKAATTDESGAYRISRSAAWRVLGRRSRCRASTRSGVTTCA